MSDRRRMLLTALGGSFAIPTFDGSYAIFGDEKQGYIECYSSGTLTFPEKGVVDVFVLGSGLCGAYGGTYSGGKGGGGAVGVTERELTVKGDYSIVVAASCSSTGAANASTAFELTAKTTLTNGGVGAAWNSETASVTNYGRSGSNGTSYPFGETSGVFFRKLGAGGGGSGSTYAGSYARGAVGGTLGGGNGDKVSSGNDTATSGAANTGSGGGGRNYYNNPTGLGGSGIVIVRWGYAA